MTSALFARALFVAAFALLVARDGLAADPMTQARGGRLSEADLAFIERTAIGGMAEMRAGEMAKRKARDPELRDFGARMVDEHMRTAAALQAITVEKGVTYPGALDRSHRRDLDALEKRDAAAFDRACIDAMRSEHERSVSDLEHAAEWADDGALRAFAARTLPIVRRHLDRIRAIQQRMA